jgi:hypothetical protein
MFEYNRAMQSTPRSSALLDRVRDASRAEAQAAAERLVAVADFYQDRLRDSGECADLAVDTWAAVAAQVGATLRVSAEKGASYLRYALVMREQLPAVGAVFEAGDIDYTLFKTIVFRTGLITDSQLMAALDAQLAALVPRWGSMSRGRLADAIDKRIAHLDADAVRRAKDVAIDRYVEIGESDAGMAEVQARLFNTTGTALDRRLDELADTVCDNDSRTRDQRRADSLDALVSGADRLVCACGQDSCLATAKRRPPGNVVIHVVADRSALEGRSQTPGYLPGADALIPAEMLRELAAAAKQLPIIPPVDAAAECSYVPSRALADFIRCRDLTCRAPGCDRPAVNCEIDHTVPHPAGPTHASNLKCLCKLHHLLKTFWGWHDEQLPDGTVIWTLPGGQKHVTTPGSALLFPTLCMPTAVLPALDPRTDDQGADRTSKMPRRSRTRAQYRAQAITAERSHNRQSRQGRREQLTRHVSYPEDPDDPPPF